MDGAKGCELGVGAPPGGHQKLLYRERPKAITISSTRPLNGGAPLCGIRTRSSSNQSRKCCGGPMAPAGPSIARLTIIRTSSGSTFPGRSHDAITDANCDRFIMISEPVKRASTAFLRACSNRFCDQLAFMLGITSLDRQHINKADSRQIVAVVGYT